MNEKMEQAGSPRRGKPNNWRRKLRKEKNCFEKVEGSRPRRGAGPIEGESPSRNDSDSFPSFQNGWKILRTPQWVKTDKNPWNKHKGGGGG